VIDTPQKERQFTDFLGRYISDNKKTMMEKVLAERTRHITVVLEDIYQSQNASAVVRTCECMGLQDIHIIEDGSKYSTNKKVLKGSDKWVDLIRYKEKQTNNAEKCFRSLRDAGYKIYATDPAPDGISIHDINPDHKIALVMGNELRGTSNQAIEQADAKVSIPMYGFTESLNISVSAAICLNTLVPKLRKSSDIEWHLSDVEKAFIRLKWYRSCVRKPDLLEREFLRLIK
jgi:tRNA (guanosine-2'-O-)-methyltransferase